MWDQEGALMGIPGWRFGVKSEFTALSVGEEFRIAALCWQEQGEAAGAAGKDPFPAERGAQALLPSPPNHFTQTGDSHGGMRVIPSFFLQDKNPSTSWCPPWDESGKGIIAPKSSKRGFGTWISP